MAPKNETPMINDTEIILRGFNSPNCIYLIPNPWEDDIGDEESTLGEDLG
jgi:hypothetical protein